MIFTRRVVAVLCLILFGSPVFLGDARGFSPHHAANQDKEEKEWRRYTVDGEDFSVMLPVVPAMMTRKIHPQTDRSRRERAIGAYSNGVVYFIHAFEKKAITLDVLIARFTRNYPAEINEPVTVGSLAGKSSSSDDGKTMRATYYFETKKNLYVFQAVGSKLGNPAIGIPKFLSSIRFETKPEGTKIVDGPGGDPAVDDVNALNNSTIVSTKEVSVKTIIIAKPEPQYTDAARRNRLSGTVVLRVVFSASGAITDIEVLTGLKDGLTEQAIAVARQIKFIPAAKDGRFVSVRLHIEYNFNLY